jgi:GMP synthase (glutamine-hydrolysing)
VQFHPEYSAAIMRSYMEHLTSELAASHRDVAALLAAVEETPWAGQVTQRFAHLVVRNGR